MKSLKIHCCDDMNFFINENKVSISYAPEYRSYAISLKKSSARQTIYYCPWCGKKFRKNLMSVWDDILEKEYGLKYPTQSRDKIPKEFYSDAWWRKRGL